MEKLLIFLVLVGISKLVEMLKNSGQPADGGAAAAPRRVPAAGDPPAELGKPGGLQGMLQELMRVPADDAGTDVAVPRPPAGVQPQPVQAVSQRSRPADRSGGQRAKGQKGAKGTKGTKRAVAGTHLSSGSATGSAVARHVETAITAHVRQHVGTGISESVRRDIGEHVEAAFGRDATGAAPAVRQGGAAESIRQILKSPRGVQQAMLVSEILNRPRIFRR